MILKHISNDKNLLWLKQCKFFQLRFLKQATLLLPYYTLRGHMTSRWRYAQFWNLYQIKAPGLHFVLVAVTQGDQWHFVTFLWERVTAYRQCRTGDWFGSYSPWQEHFTSCRVVRSNGRNTRGEDYRISCRIWKRMSHRILSAIVYVTDKREKYLMRIERQSDTIQ